MIKWILKHYRIFSITTIIAILILNELLARYQHQYPKQSLLETPILMIEIVSLLTFISFWIISTINIQRQYIHNDAWEEIYKYNGNRCATLRLGSYFTNIDIYITSNNSRLGESCKNFKKLICRNKIQGSVAIRFEISFSEERRTVNLQSKNIIIEGKLNQNSRITKIEYVPTLKMTRTLFGYSSEPIESDIDGELRITISESDSWQKEHSLFGD